MNQNVLKSSRHDRHFPVVVGDELNVTGTALMLQVDDDLQGSIDDAG